MFARLFATSGLSLDRLRALVEVGAAGSIVGAAGRDTIRQSQLSRQIKELEDFFGVRLTERQGKTLRLTAHGRELARISRFFLLGLSNYHRGCLANEQQFRIGSSPTLIDQLLLPTLSRPLAAGSRVRYETEAASEEDIERRLHDLTLDFAVVRAPALSRPLQVREIASFELRVWAPKALWGKKPFSAKALLAGGIPFVLAAREWPASIQERLRAIGPSLICDHFLEARTALETGSFAAVLPVFLHPRPPTSTPMVKAPFELDGVTCRITIRLAWNPRMLRLNTHAVRQRDHLLDALKRTATSLAGHAPQT
jgi:DNA-binding transcriptional LysR family regulator